MKALSVSNIVLDGVVISRRAELISFHHRLNTVPFVEIDEVSVVDDQSIGLIADRNLQKYIVPYDPSIVIPQYDPSTGELTGETQTVDQLMAALYSLYAYARNEYIKKTQQQDIVDVPPPNEPPV